jgi:hypothetical protein
MHENEQYKSNKEAFIYLRFDLFSDGKWDGQEWKIKETVVLCMYETAVVYSEGST